MTRVSLWALCEAGGAGAPTTQQVRPASHGTTCSSQQPHQSTLANYHHALPFPLQLNTIHVRVSLPQRPVCRRITTVLWAQLPRVVAFDPVPSVSGACCSTILEHNSQNGWMTTHGRESTKKRMIVKFRQMLLGQHSMKALNVKTNM